MKLKVYIIKKQQLIWAAVILFIVILSAILLITLRSKQTINSLTTTKTYKEDIDSDGRKDSIVVNINQTSNEYSVQVVSNDGIGYSMESDPVIKTLGYYSKSWPLNLTTSDIDNDGITELVTQSSDKKGPILHIFKYKDGKLERLASGRYSIFGTLKNTSGNSRIIVLGSKTGGHISISYLEAKCGKLVPSIVPTSLTLGKNTLATFVNFLEKNEVEASTINMDNKLTSEVEKGTFLDCVIDAKYLKNYDIPSECSYIIRTKTLDKDNNNPILYEIKMDLTKYDNKNPEYRITKISSIN